MSALARLLAVFLAALGLGGSSANPHVLHGVRSIEIRSAIGSTSVTDKASVRQIVKWFDGLPTFQPLPCPYERSKPPNVSFIFRDARGSALLRATDHAPGLCGSFVSYGNGGHLRNWPLADDGFVAKVAQLLHVSFDANAEKTAANKRAATRDVARILRLLVLPPGSRRVAKSPSSALREKAWACAGCGGRARFWKVSLPFDQVVAFEHAHRPRGSEEFESGASSKDGVTTKDVDFSFPQSAGLASRTIWVNMAPLADGGTEIRADAYVSWVVARSGSERVPAGVRTIEIEKSGGESPRHLARPAWRLVHRVTAPGKVAKIVRWFDALRIIPGLVQPTCFGMPPSTAERITFLDGSGRELARTTAEPYGDWSGECYPMTVSIGGHGLPPLLGGNFPLRVERLLR